MIAEFGTDMEGILTEQINAANESFINWIDDEKEEFHKVIDNMKA